MRRPNKNEFYDEQSDSYDYELYSEAMGDYADEQRDIQLEEKYIKEEDNENRTNSE